MWDYLREDQKLRYKKLITNFASLSEAFTQKADNEKDTITPIVNSKFQETVFQKVFGAVGEDIANTSYDASLIVDDEHKYLVGIKSFGYTSGDQKIAQFKKNSQKDDWGSILSKISKNASEADSYEKANELNKELYLNLAKKIAQLRNDRIASSIAQIKGFCATEESVKAVYHVLMPSKNKGEPQILVGETEYTPIKIDNIVIHGATSKKNSTNFKFTDGIHSYKYTSADSQLLMNFNNKDIVKDTWKVNYVKDPIDVFEHLQQQIEAESNIDYIDTVSWMIYNEHGEVEENSGFNGFNGSSKLGRPNNLREKRIKSVQEKYKCKISKENLSFIIQTLEKILLPKYITSKEKNEMKEHRKQLIDFVCQLHNEDLLNEIEHMVYRPLSEMYIPIPNSKKFHTSNPNFFGENIGKFNKNKLLLPKEKRTFRLEFLSSGDSIEAYINQDSGKAIQSYGEQKILGNWILRDVFQLKPREILTGQRLDEIGINAIRLVKYKDTSRGIGLEFLWINPESPPKDAIGWVTKNN